MQKIKRLTRGVFVHLQLRKFRAWQQQHLHRGGGVKKAKKPRGSIKANAEKQLLWKPSELICDWNQLWINLLEFPTDKTLTYTGRTQTTSRNWRKMETVFKKPQKTWNKDFALVSEVFFFLFVFSWLVKYWDFLTCQQLSTSQYGIY